MSKVLVTESNLANIANAIRGKNGQATQYKPGEMAAAIEAIPQYTDTSDATAAAGDILASKTAYIADGKATGTMPENGAVAGVIDGDNPSYTIPAGHHNGSGTVSADVATTQEVLDFLDTYPVVDEKTITENGTYAASSDSLHGYSSVTVNVPGGGEVIFQQYIGQSGGSTQTIYKSHTVTKAGYYYLSAGGWLDQVNLKVNGTQVSETYFAEYSRYRYATVQLAVGDVIEINTYGSGRLAIHGLIIFLHG